jgi:hypothetical protein
MRLTLLKLFLVSISVNLGTSLSIHNWRINNIDKSHMKTYGDSWINIWKDSPTPLSDTRINECWKSIIWCSQNKHKQSCYLLSYKQNNFFILASEHLLTEQLKIEGFLESPDNIYRPQQIEDVHYHLNELALFNNYTLDYSLLRNWSHGFYFYEYQNISMRT